MKALPILLLAILTGGRLWVAERLPVTPLEAYQWMCAQRLDWAFFDGPGGTAAVIHGTTFLLGDGPLGLRLAFPIFAALASCAAFLFARALFGSTAGIWATATLNVIPLFQSAAVHAGPEMPALTCLLFAAWAFVRALDRGVPWWIGAGFFVLLAEQFQTAAILLAVGFILACLTSRRHRGEWRKPGIYLALILTLAGLGPVFRWNQSHDWPALALGTMRTALTPQWSEIPGALDSAFLLLSIPVSLALGFALVNLIRDSRHHFRPRIILGFALPFLTFCLFLTLHGNPAAPWTLLTIAALVIASAIPPLLENSRLRIVGAALLVIAAGCSAFGGSFTRDRWTASANGVDWKSVTTVLSPLLTKAQTTGAPALFLIAWDPDATAALNYGLSSAANGKPFEVFLRESQDVSNQFGLWPRYDDFVETNKVVDEFFKNEGNVQNLYLGRSALYLTDETADDLPQTITSAFAKVTPYATLDLPAGRKLRVYLCADYQTMPL